MEKITGTRSAWKEARPTELLLTVAHYIGHVVTFILSALMRVWWAAIALAIVTMCYQAVTRRW